MTQIDWIYIGILAVFACGMFFFAWKFMRTADKLSALTDRYNECAGMLRRADSRTADPERKFLEMAVHDTPGLSSSEVGTYLRRMRECRHVELYRFVGKALAYRALELACDAVPGPLP